MTGSQLIDQGRAAFARQSWTEAYRSLSEAERTAQLAAADLACAGAAAFLLGRDAECTRLLERAYRTALAESHAPQAARTAFWLCILLGFSGRTALAGGWSSQLMAALEDCPEETPETALPRILAGLGSLAAEPVAAHAHFSWVAEAGHRFGDPDLTALGVLGRSQALIRQGRVTDALPLIDEAMFTVTSEAVSPIAVGIVYCGVLQACQEIFDVRRAGEWTEALGQWCARQPDLVPYRGECLVHRATLMQLHGETMEARQEAMRAVAWLSRPPVHPAVGTAYYELAELHRVTGDTAAAEQSYAEANVHGASTQPGLALLRLQQGKHRAAVAALSRALAETTSPTGRARLLAAYGEALLADRDSAGAGRAAQELADIARRFSAPYLEAASLRLRAAVCLEEGAPADALPALRRSLQLWNDLDAAYEAARTRVLLSRACTSLGDDEAAVMDLEAAVNAFRRIGAAPALDDAEQLLRIRGGDPSALQPASGHPQNDGGATAGALSPRELEVLQLVATGRSNRTIAADLVLSEKTVARHISNIFAKLGLGSRAAATAYAYEHGLAVPGLHTSPRPHQP